MRIHLLACSLLLLAPGVITPALGGAKPPVRDLLKKTQSILLGDKVQVEPGAWAAYRFNLFGEDEGFGIRIDARIKLSFPIHGDLEHPLPEGAYWMEFEFSDPVEIDQTFMIIKMLLKGDPRDPKSLSRVFIGTGGRRPLELGPKWLESQEATNAPACQEGEEGDCKADGRKVQRFEKKKIYSQVGWLQAQRVVVTMPNGAKQQAWVSEQVPVLGVVRASHEGVMDLELAGYGTGALSRLDETKASLLPDPEELEKELKALEGAR